MNKQMKLLLIPIILYMSGTAGCRSERKNATAEISALLQQEYLAHIEKNAEKLVNSFSDSFVSVDKGKVSYPALADSKTRFDNYFSAVNFIKWENREPPVIRFSDDGSLAYAIVRKQVILEIKARPGSRDTTNFAWTAIYRKKNEQWKLECMTSTKE